MQSWSTAAAIAEFVYKLPSTLAQCLLTFLWPYTIVAVAVAAARLLLLLSCRIQHTAPMTAVAAGNSELLQLLILALLLYCLSWMLLTSSLLDAL